MSELEFMAKLAEQVNEATRDGIAAAAKIPPVSVAPCAACGRPIQRVPSDEGGLYLCRVCGEFCEPEHIQMLLHAWNQAASQAWDAGAAHQLADDKAAIDKCIGLNKVAEGNVAALQAALKASELHKKAFYARLEYWSAAAMKAEREAAALREAARERERFVGIQDRIIGQLIRSRNRVVVAAIALAVSLVIALVMG